MSKTRNPRYMVSLDGYDLASIPSYSKVEAVKRAKQLYPGQRGRWTATLLDDEMFKNMRGGAELEARMRLERRLERRAKLKSNPRRPQGDPRMRQGMSLAEFRRVMKEIERERRPSLAPPSPEFQQAVPHVLAGETIEEKQRRLNEWRSAPQSSQRRRNATHIHAQSIDHLDVAKVHNPRLTLREDGIEGREISWKSVPVLGNEAFQYALGVVEPGGEEALFRRRANERGTYGGWRWEMSREHWRRSRSRPKRSNPSAVTELYQSFSGKRARRKNAVTAPTGTPSNLAKLGRLRLIQTTDGRRWKFSGSEAPFLAADHKQKLHVVGGRYRANPAGCECGEIARIEYETSKPHLGQETPAIYFHELGEESGERPTLVIDDEGLIRIEGGDYWIEADGIHN